MTAESFSAGNYSRANKPKDRDSENFNDRVSLTHGTREQSRVRTVLAPQMAKPPLARSYRPPAEPMEFEPVMRPRTPQAVDEGKLKANQAKMLTSRAKRKRKGS